jgi:hypothetical protein
VNAAALPLLAGGPPGWVLFGVVTVVTVGAAVIVASQTRTADRTAEKDLAKEKAEEDCEDCPCRRVAIVSRTMSPQSAQHIADAQAAGHPTVLTIQRSGAAARRAQSLAGYPPRAMMDRDEYPPAMFAEGGAGASVRYVSPSDNRSAGAQIGGQLRGAPDGCKVTIVVGP